MVWFLQEYPAMSGLLLSILIGLPTGMSVVWALRDLDKPPEKDENTWDDEWDL